jgi:hypothetical protein
MTKDGKAIGRGTLSFSECVDAKRTLLIGQVASDGACASLGDSVRAAVFMLWL